MIVPSFNSTATIRNCLGSIFDQDVDEPFEVIVVDSSSDGTEALIRKDFPEVELLHLGEQTMPARARNLGAERARGDLLAFTDADCLPERDWLRSMIKNFDAGETIVGGSVLNGRPESLISRAEYFIEFREFSADSPARRVRFLPSCNFAIRRSVFEEAGGFPEVRASEDALLAHRLTARGHTIWFDPAVRVRHLNRDRWRPYLRNQYILGKYAAVVRKLLPMPGGFFLKIPFAFPVLPLVRTLRTLQFILQNSPGSAARQLLEFLLVYPIFFAGSVVWSVGFWRGATGDESLALAEPAGDAVNLDSEHLQA